MPAKSRFTRLDAFTKTVEDARIRTSSGGIITIVSLFVVLWLAWGEWADYRRTVIHPELIVDKGRGERMEIHLNMTFPHIPCELLTLDVMDVSGEQQHGVQHGVNKVRLRPAKEGGGVIDIKAISLHDSSEAALHLDPSYCGDCYGAPAPSNAAKPGCCNTCDEVREAYAQASWAFGRGENVEQCTREHYAERLDEQRAEGCRIEGSLRVNKVVGNFHIAPGRSFSNGNMHVHDLKNYWETPVEGGHSFGHTIHSLRFGPQLPEEIGQKLGTKTMPWTNHHMNPLDGTEQRTDDPNFTYMYFVKIVPTSYLPLGWEKKYRDMVSDHIPALGAFGQNEDGSIETHQYSVTSHKRSRTGGDDSAEGHAERQHSQGGIPGVFFSYDISPMKIINREEPTKTFAGFLTGLCAVLGGTLTVAAAVDRFAFEGVTRLKKMRSKDLFPKLLLDQLPLTKRDSQPHQDTGSAEQQLLRAMESEMPPATKEILGRVRQMVPPMLEKFHKGQQGRIGVIGGSEDYTGAPYFSAMASARLGCDMSHVICTPAAGAVIKTYSPNLMVHPLMRQSENSSSSPSSTADTVAEPIIAMLARLHALVVGPGLGRDPLMQDTVARVVGAARERGLPVVLDADALLVVQRQPELVRGYGLAVLTPNVVEFGRLCKALGVEEEVESAAAAAGDGGETDKVERLARILEGVTIVQKGAVDFVSDGETTLRVDVKGGLKRSGGQGDTLTGSIATFLGWRRAYLDGLWDHGSKLEEKELMRLACFGGCAITRECSRRAFNAKGRSLQASDLTDQVHPSFLHLFGEDDPDAGGAKL